MHTRERVVLLLQKFWQCGSQWVQAGLKETQMLMCVQRWTFRAGFRSHIPSSENSKPANCFFYFIKHLYDNTAAIYYIDFISLTLWKEMTPIPFEVNLSWISWNEAQSRVLFFCVSLRAMLRIPNYAIVAHKGFTATQKLTFISFSASWCCVNKSSSVCAFMLHSQCEGITPVSLCHFHSSKAVFLWFCE